jgi:hypothetical protein
LRFLVRSEQFELILWIKIRIGAELLQPEKSHFFSLELKISKRPEAYIRVIRLKPNVLHMSQFKKFRFECRRKKFTEK